MTTATDFWSPSRFAHLTQGRWLVPPKDGATGAAALTGFSIDTRTIRPGEVFVAVRGEQHDGHDHVAAAIQRGAAMVIVEKEIANPKSPAPLLLVPDSVRALQQIAAAWRDELRKSNVKVIAVTGSNGKTSTRNMIHAALSSTLRGTQSPKSFNNHLGVPLTLLAAKCEHDFVVAEVGTNHPGEIETLAKILRPNVAVITNIGTAHIGMFGSKDAIAVEKSSLFRYLEKGGVAVMNGSQPYVDQWTKNVVPKGVSVSVWHGQAAALSGLPVGNEQGDSPRANRSEQRPSRATHTRDGGPHTTGPITADERGLHFTLESGQAVSLPMLGQHNVDNALAAFAVTRAFGIEDAAAAKALAASTGVEMRMQVSRIGPADGGITLINDAYNANPDSTVSALSTLASLPAKNIARRVAILGDMLELGDESEYEHRHIGDMLCVFNGLPPKPPGRAIAVADRSGNTPTKICLAILVGPHMKHAADQLARVWPQDSFLHIDRWSDDLPPRIAGLLREGDLVLLKASRGLRFERLVPAIEARFRNVEQESHR